MAPGRDDATGANSDVVNDHPPPGDSALINLITVIEVNRFLNERQDFLVLSFLMKKKQDYGKKP